MTSWGAYLAFGCREESLNEADSSKKTACRHEDAAPLSNKLFQKLEHAFRTKLCLSPFSSKMAIQFLHSRLSLPDGPIRFKRVVSYVLDALATTDKADKADKQAQKGNSSSASPIDWQSGCPNVIKGLRAIPIWDTSEFPWIRILEEHSQGICSELMALRGQKSFQPYRAPARSPSTSATSSSSSHEYDSLKSDSLGSLGTLTGDWNVCYLHLHGLDVGDSLQRCPITAAAVESIPRHYRHAFFSALAPNTHVVKHHGSTNKKLRCHLPLRVPKGGKGGAGDTEEGPSQVRKGGESGEGSIPKEDEGGGKEGPAPCWLRVADQTVPIIEGKAIVFDDSFEHEAANEHPVQPRVVLVVDFWHPDFDDEEVKFLEFIGKGQMASLKAMTPVAPSLSSPSPSTSSPSSSSQPSSSSDPSSPFPNPKPEPELNDIYNSEDPGAPTTVESVINIAITAASTPCATTAIHTPTEAPVIIADMEPESFLTVIRRGKEAAHSVLETAVWGV